jgi:hypothetical protein
MTSAAVASWPWQVGRGKFEAYQVSVVEVIGG